MGYSRGIQWTYKLVKLELEKLGYLLLSEKYIDNKSKLILMDKEGFYYVCSLNNLLNNITPHKFHTSNPYTIQNIKLWLKLNNKEIKLISEKYEGSNKKLKFKCLKNSCGEIFKSRWVWIYTMNLGCPYCSGQQTGLSNCLAMNNPLLASEWHPTLNGDLTPYDVTCGSSKKETWWKCSKNPKHIWKANIVDRNNGNGCPYCAGRLPSEDYNLLIINPQLCKEWNYEKNDKFPSQYTPGSGKKVWWICKEGHEWESQIGSRSQGYCCPQCSESKGEKKILKWLKINNISNEPQKEFNGLIGLGNGNLSYDFYLPDYNLLIEYQGEYHDGTVRNQTKKDFKKQQEHDKRKKQYAIDNNIKLLEIWYWDFNNIGEILESEINFI